MIRKTVCFDTNVLLLSATIFGLVLFYCIKEINKPCNSVNKVIHYKKTYDDKINNENMQYLTGDPISAEDNRRLIDPLVFPDKRDDRHNLHLKDVAIRTGLYGNYTRGIPDTPILRGYLYENVDNVSRRILPLMGYETYPNSRQFKYYTILNNVGVALYIAPKIEIEYIVYKGKPKKINKRELYDGDIVQMNELDKSRFTVKLLEHDDIRHYV